MSNDDTTAHSTAPGIRVAVYGTLKRGRSNHGLLEGAEFLGRAVIKGRYAMLDLSYYPGCVRTPVAADPAPVLVEVYRVDEEILYSLDLLEGNGTFFTREKVPTPYKNAWMYFLPTDYLERYKRIDNGIWRPTEEEIQWAAANG